MSSNVLGKLSSVVENMCVPFESDTSKQHAKDNAMPGYNDTVASSQKKRRACKGSEQKAAHQAESQRKGNSTKRMRQTRARPLKLKDPAAGVANTISPGAAVS